LHVPPGVEPYAHGKDYQTMETPWGKIGILICIDGWGFPEGFRYMSEAGVDLIFNPNLIFKKRIQKRISLLSRILDYRIPIVAPNNAVWSFRVHPDDVGMPPEGGQSNILVPPVYESPKEIEGFLREAASCEGWIVAEAGKDEEILLAKIDLSSLRRSRLLWNDAFGGFI
jgi:predicted amidohydrolase